MESAIFIDIEAFVPVFTNLNITDEFNETWTQGPICFAKCVYAFERH
tara:strand:- start:114 stop:254 length:141 start_codon:yes stop_codon:yes gene_type:complete